MEQFMEDCEKEGVAGRSCYRGIHTPSSILLRHLRERGTEVGCEGLKPGKKRKGKVLLV